jgi:superfamily II DNA/RNA helicase
MKGVSNSPLFAITWLQKLCGHPLLVEEEEATDAVRSLRDYSCEELLQQSTKLRVMYDLMHDLHLRGHRTLIFSQSTKVLDIIQYVLQDDLVLTRIDGQTKEKDRQRFVDGFNDPKSDIDGMLISTKAGGQGLTLTGADTVVVYDPSWNPAEDSQAVDRCYRIGQKKKVTVYRLISSGTVEEKRYEKQIHKDGIRRTVLSSTGSDTAKYFTKEELVREKVFVLGEEGKCEFLDKLNDRGPNTLSSSTKDYVFTSHHGVVGQSSHDIVYSLPENWRDYPKKATETVNPFSSPTAGAKWYETGSKNFQPKEKVMDDSQRNVQLVENTGGRVSIEGKENGFSRSNEILPNVNEEKNRRRSFVDELSEVKKLQEEGKCAAAMNRLMDVAEQSYESLDAEEKLEFHKNMSSGARDMKWM